MNNKKTILVCDDDKTTRLEMAEIFKNEFSILMAENGKEALQIMKKNKDSISVVLLDIIMPEMDGFEVMECVKKDDELSRIPVIVLTTTDTVDDEVKLLKTGALDFIVKPANPKVVEQRVKNVIRIYEGEKFRMENLVLKEQTVAQIQLKAMLDSILSAVMLVEIKKDIGEVVYANKSLYALTDNFMKDFPNARENVYKFVYKDDLKGLKDAVVRAIIKNEAFSYQYRIVTISGEIVWLSMQGRKIDYPGKDFPIILCIVDNITKLKTTEKEKQAALEELIYLAKYDTATHIYNKEAFYKATDEMLHNYKNKKYSLLYINIEKFKLVNDIFGPDIGNTVLVKVAEGLKEQFGNFGTYGRLESDHFAICIESQFCDTEKINKRCSEGITIDGTTYEIVFTVGIYEVEDIDLSVSKMCDRANLALQQVKGNYSTHYAYYDEKLRNSLLNEQNLSLSSVPALQNGEFVIYLQPIYSLLTMKPVSAEALVRWNSPEKGLISPGEFIPLFERTGFIVELDYYVWEQACKYISDRKKRGEENIPISINVSRMSIYRQTIAEDIIALVDKYDIDPSMLKIEITESAYTDNPKQLIETMTLLQDSGFQVLMDDFGSGYSSLNMLKELEVDILKIDMKFLGGFEHSGRPANILSSVVRMAKWLDIPVVAEGVETKMQVDYLRSIGCDCIQGYYFSRPLPIDMFESLLASEKNLNIKEEIKGMELDDFNDIFDGNSLANMLFTNVIGGIGIYEFADDKLEIIRANDGYYEIFGYSPTTFNKLKDVAERVYEDDRMTLYYACKDAIEGERKEIVIREYDVNGKILWMRLNIGYLGVKNGNDIICITMSDITKQKKDELAFRKMLENLPSGVIQYTVEEPRKLVYYNEACKNIIGYDNDDEFEAVFSERDGVFVHPDDLQFRDEALKRSLVENSPVYFECRIVKKSGEICHVRSAAEVIETNDESLVYQNVFMDITAELKMEQDTVIDKYSENFMDEYEEILEVNYKENSVTVIESKMLKPGKKIETEPLADVLKKSLASATHPDDVSIIENFIGSEADYESDAIEIRRIADGGKYRWTKIAAMPAGEDSVIICMADIDNKKKTELLKKEIEQLHIRQKDQERYEIIAKYSGTTVMEWNFIDHSFYSSDSMENFAAKNFDPFDLTKSSEVMKIVHPDDKEKIYNLIDKKYDDITSAVEEIRVKLVDGSYEWTKTTFTRFYDEEGNLERVFGTFANIDEKKKAEMLIDSLMQNLPVGFGIYKIEENKGILPLYYSDKVSEIFGCTREILDKFIERKEYNLYSRMGDPTEFRKKVENILQSSDYVEVIEKGYKNDGSMFWLKLQGRTLTDNDGNRLCYAILEDATRRVEEEKRQRSNNEMFLLLLEESQTMLFEYNPENKQVMASVRTLSGKRENHKIENGVEYLLKSNLIHFRYKKKVISTLEKVCKTGENHVVTYMADFNNTGYKWYRTEFIVLNDSQDKIYRIVGNAHNIQADVDKENLMKEQSEIDFLSKLYNRATSEKLINNKLRKKDKSYAIFVIDVDKFKHINDTSGHNTGDSVIREFCNRLKERFKKDEILGRYGGDEFIVFFEYESLEVIKKKYELIADIAYRVGAMTKLDTDLTVSAGVAISPKAGRTFGEIFKNADKALYQAKRQGGNTYAIYEDKKK